LDPHLKKLSLFDYSTKQNTIEKLKEVYLQYEENEIIVNESSSNLSETSRYSSNLFESIFDSEEYDKISEVDKYLDLRLTPLAHQSENPWVWWEARKNEFPILSKYPENTCQYQQHLYLLKGFSVMLVIR